jgi:hypothetical protein
MLLVYRLEDSGSLAGTHACDFAGDIVLVGHNGPGQIAVAKGHPVLRGRSVHNDERGYGVGVEFQIRKRGCESNRPAADARRPIKVRCGRGRLSARAHPGYPQHQCPLPLSAGRARTHPQRAYGSTDPPATSHLADRSEHMRLATGSDGVHFTKTQPKPFASPVHPCRPGLYLDPFVF